jgi:hypothetical protein
MFFVPGGRMNRQQKKARQREREKKEEQLVKDLKSLQKLQRHHLETVNRVVKATFELNKEELLDAVDRNLTASLIEHDLNMKQIRSIQDTTFILSEEEVQKLINLEKENVDMAKLQAEAREYMKELIGQGKGRKEVTAETSFKYPKLSKTMINNAFGKIQEEMEIEDAAAYILDEKKEIKEDKEMKKMSEKDVKKLAKEIVKKIVEDEAENVAEIEKTTEENREIKGSDDFEILEEVVIKEVKLKGRNGVYEAKTGLGVALENEGYKLAFSSVADVESFCNEIKKVFEMI